MKLISFLRLARPANILTAIADIMLGYAVSGLVSYSSTSLDFSIAEYQSFIFLILSTIGLYGGGIVFNDVFDAELDARERPERLIPSGKVSKISAIIFGVILFLGAIISASQISTTSVVISFIIIGLSLFYDAIGKHLFFGPINMGLCRAMNLLLGMSAVPSALSTHWYVALIPLLYISSVTMFSRSEVQGGGRSTLVFGFVINILITISVLIFSVISLHTILGTLPFLFFFFLFTNIPLVKAIKEPSANQIRNAVRAGVIGLILLDASIAVSFGGWGYALMIVLLLPVSIFLSKRFAVT
ncbi:MAG: UbiA-like protein EboC [Ignavibacteriae bacterium]|nr:UbiA-like protein EboC [Ignavibacteriota bacterium]